MVRILGPKSASRADPVLTRLYRRAIKSLVYKGKSWVDHLITSYVAPVSPPRRARGFTVPSDA
jgi:hypothetical protein